MLGRVLRILLHNSHNLINSPAWEIADRLKIQRIASTALISGDRKSCSFNGPLPHCSYME